MCVIVFRYNQIGMHVSSHNNVACNKGYMQFLVKEIPSLQDVSRSAMSMYTYYKQ